jgi:hypothetical protein
VHAVSASSDGDVNAVVDDYRDATRAAQLQQQKHMIPVLLAEERLKRLRHQHGH